MKKKKKKKVYTVIVPVNRAVGQQIYVVEASSPEEARAIVRTGDHPCESEELAAEEIADEEDWEVRDGNNKRCQ